MISLLIQTLSEVVGSIIPNYWGVFLFGHVVRLWGSIVKLRLHMLGGVGLASINCSLIGSIVSGIRLWVLGVGCIFFLSAGGVEFPGIMGWRITETTLSIICLLKPSWC